jgi:hypothetical protein
MALSLTVTGPALPASSYELPAARPLRATKVARVELQCALRAAGSAALASSACLACHGGTAGVSPGCDHPVQVRYLSARGYATGRLRAEGEVERRGVVLVAGRVECTSCHDGGSPWADHVAQLPGAPVRAPSLPPGAPAADRHGRRAIDTTPLCSACHAVAG